MRTAVGIAVAGGAGRARSPMLWSILYALFRGSFGSSLALIRVPATLRSPFCACGVPKPRFPP